MILVKMLETYQGALAGDTVGFESDAEAAELISSGKAELAPKEG